MSLVFEFILCAFLAVFYEKKNGTRSVQAYPCYPGENSIRGTVLRHLFCSGVVPTVDKKPLSLMEEPLCAHCAGVYNSAIQGDMKRCRNEERSSAVGSGRSGRITISVTVPDGHDAHRSPTFRTVSETFDKKVTSPHTPLQYMNKVSLL